MAIDIRQKVQDKRLVMVTCQRCERNAALDLAPFSDRLVGLTKNVVWNCPVCKTSQITMASDFDVVYVLEPKNSEEKV